MPSYQVKQIYPPVSSDPQLCVVFGSTFVMREPMDTSSARYPGQIRFSALTFDEDDLAVYSADMKSSLTPPELAHRYGKDVAISALRELFDAEELFDEEARMRPGSYSRQGAVAHIAEAQADSSEKFESWADQVWHNLERQPTPEEIFEAAGGDPDAMATALYLMQNYKLDAQEAVKEALGQDQKNDSPETEEPVLDQVRERKPHQQVLWMKDALGQYLHPAVAHDVVSKAICLHEFGGWSAEDAFRKVIYENRHCRPAKGYSYDDFNLPATADANLIRDILVPWIGKFPNDLMICHFIARYFLAGADLTTVYKEAFGKELTADKLL